MGRTIEPADLEQRLADVPYPVGRELAAALLDDTTLVIGDEAVDEVDLGEVVAEADVERFESVADAASVVQAQIARRTVDEPPRPRSDR